MTMFSRELTAASAKPIVLAILANGESYGYEIIQRVRELSGNEIEWAEGALYPVLHRLERQQLIKSVWRTSENGRRRKYYQLRGKGQKVLSVERKQWKLTNSVLEKLWSPEPCLT